MPTLADLIVLVRDDEVFADSTVFSDALLTRYLNEGALDMAHRFDAFIKTDTFNTVASTGEYVLSGASPKIDADFLDFYWPSGGLIYNQTSTVTTPLQDLFKSEAWLDLNIPDWQNATASDTIIYCALGFDSSGNLVLKVYPKSSTATPLVKIFYKARGTNMTDNTHYPWTGSTTNLVHTEPFQKALADYCLYKLYNKKAYMSDMAKSYLASYLAIGEELKKAQEAVFRAEVMGLRREAMRSSQETFGNL